MMTARDKKDFAIEFGEYMAKAAEQFLNSPKDDDDAAADHYRSLISAIYEFRKRSTMVVC